MGKEKFTYIQRRIGTFVGGYNHSFGVVLMFIQVREFRLYPISFSEVIRKYRLEHGHIFSRIACFEFNDT